jgi:hypothetical protein
MQLLKKLPAGERFACKPHDTACPEVAVAASTGMTTGHVSEAIAMEAMPPIVRTVQYCWRMPSDFNGPTPDFAQEGRE